MLFDNFSTFLYASLSCLAFLISSFISIPLSGLFIMLYKSFCPSSGIYEISTAALTASCFESTHGLSSGISLSTLSSRATESFFIPYSSPVTSSLLLECSLPPSLSNSSFMARLFSSLNIFECRIASTAACSDIFKSSNPRCLRFVSIMYISASSSDRRSLITAGTVSSPASFAAFVRL